MIYSHFVLILLYDFINLVTNGDHQLADGWAITQKKEVRNFALQQFDCVAPAIHQSAVLLKD